MVVVEIAIAVAVFAAALLTLTYTTALIADLTGMFRLLFIERPYRQAFRILRWLLAAVAAAMVVVAIE